MQIIDGWNCVIINIDRGDDPQEILNKLQELLNNELRSIKEGGYNMFATALMSRKISSLLGIKLSSPVTYDKNFPSDYAYDILEPEIDAKVIFHDYDFISISTRYYNI